MGIFLTDDNNVALTSDQLVSLGQNLVDNTGEITGGSVFPIQLMLRLRIHASWLLAIVVSALR